MQNDGVNVKQCLSSKKLFDTIKRAGDAKNVAAGNMGVTLCCAEIGMAKQ